MRIKQFLLLCACIFLLSEAFAQNDSTEVKKEKVPADFQLRLGADIFNYMTYAFNDTRFQSELLAEFKYNRWLFALQGGYQSVNDNRESYNYQSTGLSFKIGVERNLLKNGNEHIGFGLYYNRAFINHQANNIQVDVPIWGERQLENQAPSNAVYHIGELTFSMRVPVWNRLWLGYSLRMMQMLQRSNEAITPVYIPGFGIGQEGFNFGFNYYVLVKL